MPLACVLLFAVALSVPLGQPSQPTQSISADQLGPSLADNSGTPAQSFQLTPSQPAVDRADAPSEDVCYKIRAYIFKRDDDHAPQFVRSTTCGPKKPHTKDAVWPQGRLIPAK